MSTAKNFPTIALKAPPMRGPHIAIAQRKLGLKPDGVAGPVTCAAFADWKWRIAGYPKALCLPFLGVTGYAYLTGEKPLPKAWRARAAARRAVKRPTPETPEAIIRRQILAAAGWLFDHRREFTYAQVRPMADSIYDADARHKTDCSSYATLAYKAAGALNPNTGTTRYDGSGYTGTLDKRGEWTQDYRDGDLAFYGSSRSSTSHVAIVVRRRNVAQLNAGVPFLKADMVPGFGVLSFGSTPPRYWDTVAYRGDFVGVKTYTLA